MRFEFKYLLDDYLEFQKVYKLLTQKESPFVKHGLLVIVVFTILGIACLMLLMSDNPLGKFLNRMFSPATVDKVSWILPLSIWVAFWSIYGHWQTRRRTRALYESDPEMQSWHVVEIDDEGLGAKASLTYSRYKWAAFKGFHESTNLILLRLSPTKYVMLPKRAVAKEQLDNLRNILSQRVQAATNAFPVGSVDVKDQGTGAVNVIPSAPPFED